jgi:hypothetical protein
MLENMCFKLHMAFVHNRANYDTHCPAAPVYHRTTGFVTSERG